MASEQSGWEYCTNGDHRKIRAEHREKGGLIIRCAVCGKPKRVTAGIEYSWSVDDSHTLSYPWKQGWPRASEASNRPTFDETWMKVAKVVAERGTCPRLKVGAVIVDGVNQIVSTGYNGAARGERHCTDVGCDIEEETGRCKRTVHAEMNAAWQAGLLTNGSTLYVTHAPCLECATMILQTGIQRIVYENPYGQSFFKVKARLEDAGFAFRRLPNFQGYEWSRNA